MIKKAISTSLAPSAIGTYSQAIQSGQTVWLSGQIPLDPATMSLVGDETEEGIEMQIHQVFRNLLAVAQAAGGDLKDLVKITIYLTDLTHFKKVNEIMEAYVPTPFPARAVVGVGSLPRGAAIEAEGVLILGSGQLA